MTIARGRHTATLLRNGKVLITGGFDGITTAGSAEFYDPVAGTFSATGPMNNARADHSATLLRDGTVLVAGGTDGGFSNRSETYDPAAGAFTSAGTMADARAEHTAALLVDGTVLIAGGINVADFLNSTAIYDPASRTFTPGGSMNLPRSGHSATVLPNGKMLVLFGDSGGLSFTAVAAVRLLAALPAAGFTDPAPLGVPVKRIHIVELRTALDNARAQLALPAITYTTPAIMAGSTTIAKAHVDDLRNGVK